jgi:predicted metalloprotease with PDZ domain
LLLDLSKKYGKNKAFDDDQLFDEITKMTYPEIGDFFNRYVKGTELLPLAEVLKEVGVNYVEEEKFEDYSLGIGQSNIGVTQVESKPKLQISSAANMNAMGAALGFKDGDVLLKINGEALPDLGPELGNFIQRQLASLAQLKTLSYTVLRKDESGALKEVQLSAPVQKVQLAQRHVLSFDLAATPEQIVLRDSWLKP